jgi:hypothetical protein
MSHSIVAQRDLRPTGQYLHGPVQSMAVLTSLVQKVKARRRDRCSASEPGVVRAGPSGPGIAQQKPGAYCSALTAVLRAFQEPLAPESAPAESGGVSSI